MPIDDPPHLLVGDVCVVDTHDDSVRTWQTIVYTLAGPLRAPVDFFSAGLGAREVACWGEVTCPVINRRGVRLRR